MTPFLTSGRVYHARVYDRTGAGYVRSLGTRDPAEAAAFEEMLDRFRAQRRWPVLDLILARRLPIAEAYDADAAGTLGARIEEIQAEDAAAEVVEQDTDLDPLVAEWAPLARSARYVRQVRRLIPEGIRFPRSAFTRGRISSFLATLPNGRGGAPLADTPTRNRHRVALMQFAKWLVEREVLDHNPVRDVAGYAENDPRMVHYPREIAQTLVQWHTDPRQRALEALMAGTGCEWSAASAVRARDIRWPTHEVYAAGTKHAKGRGAKWRKRWVRFTEAWAWDLFAAYARGFAGAARLFDGLAHQPALDAHTAACAALGLERSTLHDWRHTYAIQALNDGIKPATIKRQLGHSPHSSELERVYGAHLPASDADYAKRTPATPTIVTNSVTSTSRSA